MYIPCWNTKSWEFIYDLRQRSDYGKTGCNLPRFVILGGLKNHRSVKRELTNWQRRKSMPSSPSVYILCVVCSSKFDIVHGKLIYVTWFWSYVTYPSPKRYWSTDSWVFLKYFETKLQISESRYRKKMRLILEMDMIGIDMKMHALHRVIRNQLI